VISQGTGPPIVLIPGIQGRWEWMAPAIESLADHHEVLTFSLGVAKPPGLFGQWTEYIDRIIERSGSNRAAIVGVSFGGLVAAWYASRRPLRTASLVLVSTPSPRWRIDPETARYTHHPRLSLPLFAARGATRLLPEVMAALPGLAPKARFGVSHGLRTIRFPLSPTEMVQIVREWEQTDLETAARAVTAPTLVVTGEERLDRVVPVQSSLEWLSMIPGARQATLARTGHLGIVLRPREFAAIVTDFIDTQAASTPARREETTRQCS
jgi:pimeloyl-ACP methyl ester carboxylesterase